MSKESRVKKSLLNAKINMICYFVSLFVAFFTRKVLLDNLGSEFLGLTGTIGSLLGFLNLAELGVGTAIGYVLYKPIFEDNRQKINEIISVLGYIYRCIGIFILGCGFLLSLFIPLIFPNTSFSWLVIYLGYYSYLFASLLSYFVNYKMNLLAADQRNYVITGYFQATTTTKVIMQMVLAFYFHSFYLYFLLEILFSSINSIILNYKIRKTYPWLESEIRKGKALFSKYPEIGKYVKQLFIHKIGGFVQFQIAPFFIYSFVSLPVVALYSNYTMLTQRIQSLVSGSIDNSLGAGVGNLISEGNQKKIYSIYRELLSLRFFVIGVLSACLYQLISPFIIVWLGEDYPLSNTDVLLIILHFFLSSLRGTTDQFLFGFGLFYDIWAPAVEAAIFIVVSMIGGYLYGLTGVLLGPIISLFVIVHVWKPFFLYQRGFKLSFISYVFIISKYLLYLAIPLLISLYCFRYFSSFGYIQNSWLSWFVQASTFTIFISILSFFIYYTFSTDFRSIVKRLIFHRSERNDL